MDLTEPICQAIDSAKADMTIFDSAGIEACVTENKDVYKRQKRCYVVVCNYIIVLKCNIKSEKGRIIHEIKEISIIGMGRRYRCV